MSADRSDRRQTYDLDHFADGGFERRKGPWNRRSVKDRRLGTDRRLSSGFDYGGIERRSGKEMRSGKERREFLTATSKAIA